MPFDSAMSGSAGVDPDRDGRKGLLVDTVDFDRVVLLISDEISPFRGTGKRLLIIQQHLPVMLEARNSTQG